MGPKFSQELLLQSGEEEEEEGLHLKRRRDTGGSFLCALVWRCIIRDASRPVEKCGGLKHVFHPSD